MTSPRTPNHAKKMTVREDKPSKVDIERFKFEVSRLHLQYLKKIRTRGYAVDEAEIARLESELAAEEAKLGERKV